MTSSTQGNIAILYLGTMGAGVKFMELLASEIPKNACNVYIFTRKEHTRILSDSDPSYPLKLPKSKALVFAGFGRKKVISSIVEILRAKQIRTVLIPMSHPWDLYLQKKLESSTIQVVRIVHDSSPHPGDIWPRKRHIKMMLQADIVVTLSDFTYQKLRATDARYIQPSIHPFLPYLKPSLAPTINRGKSYDLIIGRQKNYQNVKNTVNWWKTILPLNKQGRELVVAGKVGFLSAFKLRYGKIEVVNKWLTEQEFVDLISGANRILCLYSEASQSGIVSAAQQFGVPVLVTSVGGLPEQIDNLGGGLIVDFEKKSDWSEKYEKLNFTRPMPVTEQKPNKAFINDIEKAIRYSLTSEK